MKMTVPPRVSRRGVLGGMAAGGLGLLGLSACSNGNGDTAPAGGSSDGVLRVGYFGWVGSMLNDWMGELTEKFQDENAGVTVQMIPVASSEATTEALVQKLSLEARQGEASYDLLLGPTPWIEVGALARADAVLPVDEYIQGYYADNLAPAARTEATSNDGKMYCMPFWADVVGFMDRPSMQTQYGVTPPETWDDLIAQVQSGGLPNDVYHYGADWTQVHRLFLPIMATYTDDVFLGNGVIDMSSDAALRSLEIMKELTPGMPAAASTPGAHLDSFYADQTMSQTYWQSGIWGSVNSGLPEDDVTYRANLRGDSEGTFFWTTSAAIPKASRMPEAAAKFVTETMASEWGMKKSVEVSQAVPPMTNLSDSGADLPPQVELANSMLETAIGLPANDAWLSVESPAFTSATERMMAEDRDPSQVQEELVEAFAEYE